MTPPPEVACAAFVGIDWSDTKHDICLQAGNSEEREFAVVPHRPAAIDAWAGALRQRFQGRPGGGVPGARQGTARLCVAEARLPGALPGSSGHAGEISRGIRTESCQGRSERRAVRAGAAASLSRQAESLHSTKRSHAHAAAA